MSSGVGCRLICGGGGVEWVWAESFKAVCKRAAMSRCVRCTARDVSTNRRTFVKIKKIILGEVDPDDKDAVKHRNVAKCMPKNKALHLRRLQPSTTRISNLALPDVSVPTVNMRHKQKFAVCCRNHIKHTIKFNAKTYSCLSY
jgi:hypothetical protein